MATAAGEPLSFDDAQILGLESDAIKGHTGKLLVLERGPDGAAAPDDVRARVSERLPALPLLRRRIDTPRRGDPVWVEDSPDPGWHVSAHEPAEPLDDEGFRAFAGEILSERLDHSRPLWRFDAVPLAADRLGLVARIHHALADGVTAIRTLEALLWDEPAATHDEHAARPKTARPAPPESERRERPLLVRLPRALRRELRPGADTPLDRHIGSEREVAWTVLPLARLKAIGRAGGGTVNDAVLAVVAGALRGWLGEHGSAPVDVRAQIPVCLHLRDDDAAGNRDSFLNVDLPLHEPDPLERLRTIVAETRERKFDHDAEALYAFFHALGHFRPLYMGVTRLISGPREFALSVSNVPGPRERPAICGHELREFCSFAEPADRHALRVAVLSLGDELAFGLCSDPAAIGGLDRLAERIELAAAELEEAAA
jgi:diacylglycerol O-acyltransferase / wax synthase